MDNPWRTEATVHCTWRDMESPIAMTADSVETSGATVTASSPANGRTSVNLSEMASVDWSQHRVFFSRFSRTAFASN